jgi:hypothetical protein
MPDDSKVEQCLQGRIRSLGRDGILPRKMSQYLSHLDIQKMRSVQRLVDRADSVLDPQA